MKHQGKTPTHSFISRVHLTWKLSRNFWYTNALGKRKLGGYNLFIYIHAQTVGYTRLYSSYEESSSGKSSTIGSFEPLNSSRVSRFHNLKVKEYSTSGSNPLVPSFSTSGPRSHEDIIHQRNLSTKSTSWLLAGIAPLEGFSRTEASYSGVLLDFSQLLWLEGIVPQRSN